MSGFICTACKADAALQSDCEECLGSGVVRDVPFAKDPWNELVPDLWLGGHFYGGGLTGTPSVADGELLTLARFEVVVSLYQKAGCWAPGEVPAGVEGHYFRVPDGSLTYRELQVVRDLGELAAKRAATGHKTLIRCAAGLNRSSLAAGYALRAYGFTASEAIDIIRQERSPYALCNGEFVAYLLASEGVPTR